MHTRIVRLQQIVVCSFSVLLYWCDCQCQYRAIPVTHRAMGM